MANVTSKRIDYFNQNTAYSRFFPIEFLPKKYIRESMNT